jgi:hypothetical protein
LSGRLSVVRVFETNGGLISGGSGPSGLSF